MQKYFGPKGRLKDALTGYEQRPGQEEMARSVYDTFNKGGALLAEAGTGVGKTFAYLIPALLSGKKVVISTGTKNLQDQIAKKDLPLLEKVFEGERPFKAAIMKGRGNYLCKRRFKSFAQQPLFNESKEERLFDTIQSWAKKTETGDRAEITAMPDDYFAWSEINSKTELCLGSACPTFDECFVTIMRTEASKADIVVVNHHLFFADLAVKKSAFGEVIPEYEVVVFDEAHQIEETAGSYFGMALSNHRISDAVRDSERELATAGIGDRDIIKVTKNLSRRSSAFFDGLRDGAEGRYRLKKKDFDKVKTASTELLNTLSLTADAILSFEQRNRPGKSARRPFPRYGRPFARDHSFRQGRCCLLGGNKGPGSFPAGNPYRRIDSPDRRAIPEERKRLFSPPQRCRWVVIFHSSAPGLACQRHPRSTWNHLLIMSVRRFSIPRQTFQTPPPTLLFQKPQSESASFWRRQKDGRFFFLPATKT